MTREELTEEAAEGLLTEEERELASSRAEKRANLKARKDPFVASEPESWRAYYEHYLGEEEIKMARKKFENPYNKNRGRDRMAKEYPCVKKAKEIDRRAKGKAGRTKSGKYIRDPDAYVFGGMRKQGWKPRRQRGRRPRRKRGLVSELVK